MALHLRALCSTAPRSYGLGDRIFLQTLNLSEVIRDFETFAVAGWVGFVGAEGMDGQSGNTRNRRY